MVKIDEVSKLVNNRANKTNKILAKSKKYQKIRKDQMFEISYFSKF